MGKLPDDIRPGDRIAIIGAGMAGIAMGAQLKRLLNHENFHIYEKGDDIGGTWAQNRYPNLSCDVVSEVSLYYMVVSVCQILISVRSSTHSRSSRMPTGQRNTRSNQKSSTTSTTALAISTLSRISLYNRSVFRFPGLGQNDYGHSPLQISHPTSHIWFRLDTSLQLWAYLAFLSD